MKKSLRLINIFLIGICGCSFSYAKDTSIQFIGSPTDPIKEGFYLGAGGGAGWLNGKRTVKANTEDPLNAPLILSDNKSISPTRVFGQILLGYHRKVFSKTALGLEGYGGITNFKNQVSWNNKPPDNAQLTSDLKVNQFWGIGFRISHHFASLTPYLKAGVEWARFQHTFSQFQDTLLDQSKKITKFKPGASVTIGAEKKWGPVDLRLDYTASFYQSINLSFADNEGAINTQQLKNPTMHRVTLSLVRYF